MKIVEKKKKNYIKFEDLNQGEIFEFEESYFFKIELLVVEKNRYVNAVSIDDGFCLYIKSYEDIIPINATLTIGED